MKRFPPSKGLLRCIAVTLELLFKHPLTIINTVKIISFRSTVAIALLSNLAFMLPAFAASNPLASCSIRKSVYTAIGKPDYKVTFGEPPANSRPDQPATATLQHTKRGNLGTFVVEQGQGYGVLSISEIQTRSSTQNKKREFILLFFNSSLRAVQNLQPAPTYMHIAGLGVSDAYSQQNGSRDYPLGDVMWQLSSCRK
jgi:hypothetical protein